MYRKFNLTRWCLTAASILLFLTAPVENEWIEIAQNNQKSHKNNPVQVFTTTTTARVERMFSTISATSAPQKIIKGTVQRAELKKFKSYPAHIEKLQIIKSSFPNETLTTESLKMTTDPTTKKTTTTTTTTTESTLQINRPTTEEIDYTDNNYDSYRSDLFTTEDSNEADNYINSSFIPYIKSIQDSLIEKTQNSGIKSKIVVLKKLRDGLLFDIKNRINNLWKPQGRSHGEARHYEEEDSHMDFPSNEGALMTIGFLTFAVFLIKLVLKLIHLIKAKQNGMMPDMMNMNMVSAYIGRKRRDVVDDEAIKILSLIEQYKLD